MICPQDRFNEGPPRIVGEHIPWGPGETAGIDDVSFLDPEMGDRVEPVSVATDE
ncbi:MAG: hypothetical protein MUQ27_14200 [Acidimicrobiia bacterium]|nr:hypothetical protein [Acidimicrobiia bacterium]